MRRFFIFGLTLFLYFVLFGFFSGKVFAAINVDKPDVPDLPSPGDTLSVYVSVTDIVYKGVYCSFVYGVEVTPSGYIDPDRQSKEVQLLEGSWTSDSQNFVFNVVSDKCVTGSVDFTATPYWYYIRCDGTLEQGMFGSGETTTLSNGIGSTLNVNVYKPDGSPANGATISISGTYSSPPVTGSSAQFRRLNCSLSHTITASLAGYGSATRTGCSGYDGCLCNGQERTLNLTLSGVAPTPTPTPTPIQCKCTYSEACTVDGQQGARVCNGICQNPALPCSFNNNCAYDSSGGCPPACGPCTGGVTPPPPPPPSGCSFSSCGASGCQPDQRYVSGTCSYSWYFGPGCYYDTSCGGDDDYVPPTTGPDCYSDDIMYFEPSVPGQGELLTVVVLSKGPSRYLSIALDITYPSNAAGVQVRTSPLYPAIPAKYQVQGYQYSWSWLIGPAQIGTTPYLFEFSVNSRSQYCVSKSLFIEQTPPTCTVSLSPSSINAEQGQTSTLVANTQVSNGTVSRVDFSSSNTAVASVNPTSDSSSPYSTTVSMPGVGTAILTGNVYLNPGGILGCTDTTPITITPPSPWFQSKGGDLHAQGDVVSPIPGTLTSNKYLSLLLDGYPGLVSFGSGFSFGSGGGIASQIPPFGWLASDDFSPGKSTFDYFYRKLGSPTTDNFSCEDGGCPAPTAGQTTIYYSLNSVTIDGNNSWTIPANTKVVALVNGDLNISLNLNRRITVPVGSFLAFFVKGNINIGGNVGNKDASASNPHLQGMYIADGVVDTYEPDPVGVGLGSGFRFIGAGLFYGRTGFTLGRDIKNDCPPLSNICNATTPSELFTFRPDLVLNAPHELWYSKMSWLEVAP